MSIYEKLLNVQAELKAPKGQYNSFGKYSYRSCEDILEAVKPLLKQNGLSLIIGDSVELIGERFYVKATARLVDVVDGNMIENSAFAREEQDKKGMDGSQITGTASSYARKYCLNGLFNIDDTKDADTDEYQKQNNRQSSQQSASKANSASNTESQLKCEACGAVIDSKVADYSRRKYGKELCRKCQANPQPTANAHGNDWVKIENGTDYLVKNNNDNWLRVESLSIKACELILNDPKYALAYKPVETHMQALALAQAK